jgi:hypothetical protein
LREVCFGFYTLKSELAIGLGTISSQACRGDSKRKDGHIATLELRDTFHTIEMLKDDSILN